MKTNVIKRIIELEAQNDKSQFRVLIVTSLEEEIAINDDDKLITVVIRCHSV